MARWILVALAAMVAGCSESHMEAYGGDSGVCPDPMTLEIAATRAHVVTGDCDDGDVEGELARVFVPDGECGVRSLTTAHDCDIVLVTHCDGDGDVLAWEWRGGMDLDDDGVYRGTLTRQHWFDGDTCVVEYEIEAQ